MRARGCTGSLILGLGFLIVAQPCAARYISLDVKPKAEFIERFLTVSTSIVNSGDEPAYKLQGAVEFDGRSTALPTIDELAAKEERTVKATLPVGAVDPGSYTAVVRVGYTDKNGYVFSTLNAASLSKWVNPPSPVAGYVTAGDVTSSGEVLVQVVNLVKDTVPVRIRLLASRDLTITPAEMRVVVPGQGEERLRFAVRNMSALPGSSYAVFAVLDAETHDGHTSTTQTARIPILASAGTPSASLLVSALAATPIIILLFIRLARWGAGRLRKVPSQRAMPGRVS